MFERKRGKGVRKTFFLNLRDMEKEHTKIQRSFLKSVGKDVEPQGLKSQWKKEKARSGEGRLSWGLRQKGGSCLP